MNESSPIRTDTARQYREVPTLPPPAPTRRRNRLGRWMLVLLALGGVGAVAHRTYEARRAPTEETAAAPGRGGAGRPGRPTEMKQAVGIAPIVTASMPVVLQGLGTVTPLATVTVRSQISGYLTQIGYREGQTVKRGDFLAQIDPRPYEALLAQYQGQLARDQALLQNARLDLTRYQTLNRQDSISKQNVDTQAALVKQNEGTVAADQALVDQQRLNLTYARIISPVEGRVGLRQVDLGNYITAGSTNIVVVTQLHPISVVFTLPEDDVARVMRRLRQGAKLTVRAYDRGDQHEIATGRLDTIDNQIDVTTGTVKLRALFDNDEEELFPNQFVNARLTVETIENAPVVPNAAILRGTPGTYVYLMDGDDKVTVRPITTGETDGTRSVVLSGLAPGDRVVTDGTDRLREGAPVRVVGETPGPQAGTPAPGAPGAAAGPAAPGAPIAASSSPPSATGSTPTGTPEGRGRRRPQ
ncbi:MdtA/MuxA family multidrug efflux RND transporter periplasmic adaptor subunit [Methylobacterium sp. Leaf118]|uniref:MdtA/MuxA family multidrug efflux RND transporter periplasmic adaptor subunit n=1 Tax=Methylobacterium sp. Leaf118 TaxID=2876562 RepID=UPI001E3CC027|nr:MdtA/MuxA family multidrug efflux RND transporter periplasmic adaptor subunit [Methylobacterium sp. Leaf118]